MEDVDEISAAIGAGDLAVAKHVAGREKLLLEQLHAIAAVGFAAVVAVAEVEEVDVPFIGRIVGLEQLLGTAESAADLGAAVFAEVVEGVLVDLLGRDVVDDVAGLYSLVVLAEPGVDPEALEADEFFLFLAH